MPPDRARAAAAPPPTLDAKRRIIAQLNARFRTTLTVDMLEQVVEARFTSWDALAAEVDKGDADAVETGQESEGHQ
jgi:hypothetical protein